MPPLPIFLHPQSARRTPQAGNLAMEKPRADSGRRASRLHCHVIPITRIGGLGIVTALIAIHTLAVLGAVDWTAVWTFAFVGIFYGLGSWLTLVVSFLERRRLATLFLVLDVAILLFAIHLTGGTSSWLFLLLAARCTDQIFFGVRRVIWFSHLLVGSYALYVAVVASSDGEVNWKIEAAKLTVLYAFTWYYALTARAVDLTRRRSRKTNVARRQRAELEGTVSHAIGTRTAAVAAVLESLNKGPLDAKQREHIRVLTEVNQSLAKFGTLLNASENQLSRMEEQTRFTPPELLKEVASLVRPLAESKQLDLRVDVASVESIWVTGDSGNIRQVLLSLAHNAVRFTDRGFIELRASRIRKGQFGFEVKDSGTGIPVHLQRRLLAPFLRADGSPWHRTRGSGIGLGISRRLIQSMGGTLELDSMPGLGTTIRFTLHLPECDLAECDLLESPADAQEHLTA